MNVLNQKIQETGRGEKKKKEPRDKSKVSLLEEKMQQGSHPQNQQNKHK